MKQALKILCITILLFTSFGINGIAQQLVHLSPEEFLKVLDEKKDIQLLDIRSHSDYQTWHFPGAINLDPISNNFNKDLKEQLPNKDTLYIYCRVGITPDVIELLSANGYKNIITLKGGLTALELYKEKMDRIKKRQIRKSKNK